MCTSARVRVVAGFLTVVATGLDACGRTPDAGAMGTHPEASAPTKTSPSPAAALGTVVADGMIYVGGNEPVTMVMLWSDTTTLALSGDLVGELRRLSGASVEVRGAPDSAGTGNGIRVGEYTVLAIDGRRPKVGLLASSGSALWLLGTDSLALADPEGRLSRLVGAKIWVVPDTTGLPASVLSYGVIRDPDD